MNAAADACAVDQLFGSQGDKDRHALNPAKRPMMGVDGVVVVMVVE